jgi:hypothetical protein
MIEEMLMLVFNKISNAYSGNQILNIRQMIQERIDKDKEGENWKEGEQVDGDGDK